VEIRSQLNSWLAAAWLQAHILLNSISGSPKRGRNKEASKQHRVLVPRLKGHNRDRAFIIRHWNVLTTGSIPIWALFDLTCQSQNIILWTMKYEDKVYRVLRESASAGIHSPDLCWWRRRGSWRARPFRRTWASSPRLRSTPAESPRTWASRGSLDDPWSNLKLF